MRKVLRSRKFVGALSMLGVSVLLFPLLTMGVACGNGNNPSSQTPFQLLEGRVSIIELDYARSTDLSSIAGDIIRLRDDIEDLEASTGKDWTGDISTLSGEIDALQALLDELEAKLADFEAGGTTIANPLELALLSVSPLIVSGGSYAFTVRVTNTAIQPETGRIVLQLHAYSGSVAITSASVASTPTVGNPSFMAAEYDPAKSAAQTITVFSDSIVVGASSSKIYEFTLILNQGGASFEWISILQIAQ